MRAIGREMALSASQVSRVLHDPITPLGVGCRLGSVESVNQRITKSGMVAPPIFETKPVKSSRQTSLKRQDQLIILTKPVHIAWRSHRRPCLRGSGGWPGRAG